MTTTPANSQNSEVPIDVDSDGFLQLYAQRLGLPKDFLLNAQPTHELLCDLQERQLANIPFENLAQHGAKGGPVVLDLAEIAHKILRRHRGGFCLELNSLYAHLLQRCGFVVTIVEATVFKYGTFDGVAPSHICLMVSLKDNESSVYYVDVGFGEPPLYPLRMEFHKGEQVTPEGMRSRIMPANDDDDDNSNSHAVLQWFQNGTWEPRLKWKVPTVTTKSLTLSDTDYLLKEVSKETSIFSKKLVVCRLTRDKKFTVAGSTFKVTGCPRFLKEGGASSVPVEKTEGLSLKQIQDILWREFGMPNEETPILELEKSNQKEATDIWSTL